MKCSLAQCLFFIPAETENGKSGGENEAIGEGLGLREKLTAAHLVTKHAKKKKSDGCDHSRSDKRALQRRRARSPSFTLSSRVSRDREVVGTWAKTTTTTRSPAAATSISSVVHPRLFCFLRRTAGSIGGWYSGGTAAGVGLICIGCNGI